MEKLQAALEQARKNRQASGTQIVAAPSPVGPVGARTKEGGELEVDELWQLLTPSRIDEGQLEKHRVVTRVSGEAAVPFDILRTKVLLQMQQNGWKRLAITSPMPRSGKTTTACNLALGLGRQNDLRSILMDLDLRDPSVHRFFGLQPAHGIVDLLTGRVDFSEQAVRIGENVACSMALPGESDPTRLLLAEETATVLDTIEATYKPDIMMFDLPSVLVNDSTRAFLKNVDCVLIVIRANSTRYSQFDVCEREMAEHTNVLGVVLNAYTNIASSSGNV